MKKNPICTILWRDAFYTYEPDLPETLPLPHLVSGLIIETSAEHTFIATNVAYEQESGNLDPVDGFVVPDKAIIKFKKIGDYNE